MAEDPGRGRLRAESARNGQPRPETGHAGWLTWDTLLEKNSRAMLRFLDFYEEVYKEGNETVIEFHNKVNRFWETGTAELQDDIIALLQQALARLKQKIRREIRLAVLQERMMVHTRKRRRARFGLLLDPHNI